MISPDEALKKILDQVEPLPAEEVLLEDSQGRILVEDIYAREDLPPFHNSAMDGYAVRSTDVSDASQEHPTTLEVGDVVPAGNVPRMELGKDMAIKIMTGSPLPIGADAVVIKENTQPNEDDQVMILQRAQSGDNIRSRGEDVRSGSVLMGKGTLIRPYEVALLAAQGITEIPMIRKPRVAVIATGDELVDISKSPSAGQIRNSNGPAMVSSISRWGVEACDIGICRDDPDTMESKFKSILPNLDVLLISGGVSVGDFDYTRYVLDKLGFMEIFWKVAIKPGKPLLFGIFPSDLERKKPATAVFGLPGNPVSVMVCLEEFVRPLLERLRGYTPKHPGYHIVGEVENSYITPEERQQYVFCRVSQDQEIHKIHIIKPQGSAMMGKVCQANALAIVPIGIKRVEPGDVLSFRWLK
jgi:molybdopterin molybdotransferase